MLHATAARPALLSGRRPCVGRPTLLRKTSSLAPARRSALLLPAHRLTLTVRRFSYVPKVHKPAHPPSPPPVPNPNAGTPPPGFWPTVVFFREYIIAGIVILICVAILVWWGSERVPESGRLRIMFYPRSVDIRLGNLAEQQLLLSLKLDPPKFAAEKAMVQQIADTLQPVSGIDSKLRVSIADEPTPNAFVLPNGKCVVNSGLLKMLEGDKDMLAIVLAHEIAHVRARHAAEKLSNRTLLMLLTGFNVSDLGEYLLDLPFSRQQEEEADYLGLLCAARACFNPEKGVRVWQLFVEESKKHLRPPQFLSTHPNPDQRLSKTREWLPKAKQERSSHCGTAAKAAKKAKKEQQASSE